MCTVKRTLYLEWSTGIEHFVSMLPMMMASRREHVPDSQRGINIPEVSEEATNITKYYQVFHKNISIILAVAGQVDV